MTQEQWIAGRYRCLYKLGRGGFSEVFLAEDVRLGNRKVALKRVAAHFMRDDERILKFQQEAQIIGHLTNPYTVRAFDFGQDEDRRYYIAMEYVQGETLHDILKRENRLSIERGVKIAIQMLDGLAEAHRMGVIHRDLKPKNVMLVPQRHGDLVKILDFGVARILRGDLDPEKDEWTLVGTATYMAPEQAQGLPVSPASDIYSVGVILYHMLSGRPPFMSKEDPVAVMIHHALSEAPPLRETFPELDIPVELDRLVLKALQKKPEARFQYAHEFCNQLEQFWESWFVDQSHSVVEEAETFKHALDPEEQKNKKAKPRGSWHSDESSSPERAAGSMDALPDHTLSRNRKASDDLIPGVDSEPPTQAQGAGAAYTKETKSIGVSWASSKDGLVGLASGPNRLPSEDLATEKPPVSLHDAEDPAAQTQVEIPASSPHIEIPAIIESELEPTASKPQAPAPVAANPSWVDLFNIRSQEHIQDRVPEQPKPTAVMEAPDLDPSHWPIAPPPPTSAANLHPKEDIDTTKDSPQDTDKNNILGSSGPQPNAFKPPEILPPPLPLSVQAPISAAPPEQTIPHVEVSSEWEVPTVGEANVDHLKDPKDPLVPAVVRATKPASSALPNLSQLPPPSLQKKGAAALNETLQDVFRGEEDFRSTQEYGDEVDTAPDAAAAATAATVRKQPAPSPDRLETPPLYALSSMPPHAPPPDSAGLTEPTGFAALPLPSPSFLPPTSTPIPTWSPYAPAPAVANVSPVYSSPMPPAWQPSQIPQTPSFSKANGIAPPPPFPQHTPAPFPPQFGAPPISIFESQPAATWTGKGIEDKTYQSFLSPFSTNSDPYGSSGLFSLSDKDSTPGDYPPSLRWRWFGLLGGFIFVLGLLILLASVGDHGKEQKRLLEEEAYRTALQEGDQEVAANRYLRAYLSYRRALLLRPNSEDAKRRMRLAKLDLDAASQLRHAKRLIRKQRYWDAYHLLIKLDPKTSSNDEKKQLVAALHPHLVASLANQVQTWLQQRQWSQAVRSCQALAQYDPNHPLLQRPCLIAARKNRHHR